MADPTDFLACPRCDKFPLEAANDGLHCKACKIDFPLLGGIPWMFAEPGAALGEWRGRYQMWLQQLGREIESLDSELKNDGLRELTRRRMSRYRKCVDSHMRSLQKLLRPLELKTLTGNLESYLALRTRLPSDQGLNTYYQNVHRDWAWGDDENQASMKQVRAVLHDHSDLGNVLVLGAGAGRLAYDIHREMNCVSTTLLDFNPLLMLIAQTVASGKPLSLYEFPIAPLALEDDAVRRKLCAPEVADDTLQFVIGDALRPPFPEASFDTVVTPWLIDVVGEDLPRFAARVNSLLKENGRWVNFGSLAFSGPERARHYSPEEAKAIVTESGFSDPYVSQATIPYMDSPASRHGRQERVFTFSCYRERAVEKPARHTALPDWIVTGKEPVPLTASFRQQAMTTQIYSFIMSLIDGKRSIKDMAGVLESQKLMTREEAEASIRSFMTRMHDDAQRQSGF